MAGHRRRCSFDQQTEPDVLPAKQQAQTLEPRLGHGPGLALVPRVQRRRRIVALTRQRFAAHHAIPPRDIPARPVANDHPRPKRPIITVNGPTQKQLCFCLRRPRSAPHPAGDHLRRPNGKPHVPHCQITGNYGIYEAHETREGAWDRYWRLFRAFRPFRSLSKPLKTVSKRPRDGSKPLRCHPPTPPLHRYRITLPAPGCGRDGLRRVFSRLIRRGLGVLTHRPAGHVRGFFTRRGRPHSPGRLRGTQAGAGASSRTWQDIASTLPRDGSVVRERTVAQAPDPSLNHCV